MSAARNAGWRWARSPIVLFIGDDILAHGRLRREHMKWHERHPGDEVGVLAHTRWARELKVTPFMRWLDHGIQFDYPNIKGTEAGWGRFYTSNASVKRALLERVGGFDEAFPFQYEDLELARRMHEHGFRLPFNRRARAEHLHSVSLDSWRRRVVPQAHAERQLVQKYPDITPYFFDMYPDAAGSPPVRGRARFAARFVPRWVNNPVPAAGLLPGGRRPRPRPRGTSGFPTAARRNSTPDARSPEPPVLPSPTVVDVDVGVVTYETRDMTVAALTRLVADTPDVRFRVLVHDNASTDGTAEAVAANVPVADIEVSERNLGFAAGMNRIIERSTAPWFLALNSDAWPEPGAIAKLLEVGERDSRIAAVAPRLERPDGALEHSTHPFPSLRVAAITALGAYRRLWPRTSHRLGLVTAWDHDEARDVDWAVGAALLMRRAAIDAVGGFDESFFMYAEDLEWCWRVREGGWAIRFEPSAVVQHVGNVSGRAAYGDRRTRAHVHNSYRFYRRLHGRAGTLAYRALSVAGYGRLYLLARLRRDAAGRREWSQHLRAHLSRIPSADAPP